MGFKETELAAFRKRLLEEKARLAPERASAIADETTDSPDDQASGLPDSELDDPADAAGTLTDRERDMAAAGNIEGILQKIERALKKIDEGTYGLSDVDGTPIPRARLEALPYALATVEQEDSL